MLLPFRERGQDNIIAIRNSLSSITNDLPVMSLEILYHDQWLVVVDKPAGMLVHPGRDPEPVEQIAMKTLRDQCFVVPSRPGGGGLFAKAVR